MQAIANIPFWNRGLVKSACAYRVLDLSEDFFRDWQITSPLWWPDVVVQSDGLRWSVVLLFWMAATRNRLEQKPRSVPSKTQSPPMPRTEQSRRVRYHDWACRFRGYIMKDGWSRSKGTVLSVQLWSSCKQTNGSRGCFERMPQERVW